MKNIVLWILDFDICNGVFESRRLDWDMIIIGFIVFRFVVFNNERLDYDKIY
ncbi:unnamed protein product [Meloidogyne enterolobii]|uniref:Uncharacterized protein n=1 Tax=Meloidogyne enterolobii TaxID=390850 RepID=A0ACB1A7W3_MELEN